MEDISMQLLIETQRLLIKPFTLELILAAKNCDHSIYQKIGIIPNVEWPEEDLKEALPVFESMITENGITGFGSWVILSRNNEIIGSAGFIGEPENGVVEVGFGIISSQQNKGYCTEALRALIEWAKSQKEVDKIIAHTNADNSKSIKVLRKSGFQLIDEKDGLLKWKFDSFRFVMNQ